MSCIKRDSSSNVALSCNSIILDIEGTTSSISFVKDVLFPYVRDNLQEYVSKKWGSESLQETICALRTQADEDKTNNIDGVVTIPENGTKDELLEAVTKNVIWLMDNDRKTKSLKDLQGLIMEEGYLKGDLKGHVYDDVEESLKSWTSQDKSVYIYSSGSVHAQKLLFAHSIKGNLLKFISGHFDTSVGPKQETDSYRKILEKISCSASETAFFTDVPKEAIAAKEAGVSAILLSREGNAPLSDEEKAMFPVISSFDVIVFESNPKKVKLCNDNDNIQENKPVQSCALSSDSQKNPDSSNIISDGDIEMRVTEDKCASTEYKNGEEQFQSSKNSINLASAGDEEMLEVQSLSHKKKDEVKKKDDVKEDEVKEDEVKEGEVKEDEVKEDENNVKARINLVESAKPDISCNYQKAENGCNPAKINSDVTAGLNGKILEEGHEKISIGNCDQHKDDSSNKKRMNGEKVNGDINKAHKEQNSPNVKTSPADGTSADTSSDDKVLEKKASSENIKMNENENQNNSCAPTDSEILQINGTESVILGQEVCSKKRDDEAINGSVQGDKDVLQAPSTEGANQNGSSVVSSLVKKEESLTQHDKIDVALNNMETKIETTEENNTAEERNSTNKGKPQDNSDVKPNSEAAIRSPPNAVNLSEDVGISKNDGQKFNANVDTTVSETLEKTGISQSEPSPLKCSLNLSDNPPNEKLQSHLENKGNELETSKCNADPNKVLNGDTPDQTSDIPISKMNTDLNDSTKSVLDPLNGEAKNHETEGSIDNTVESITTNGEAVAANEERPAGNLVDSCKVADLTQTCDSSKTENIINSKLASAKEIDTGVNCDTPIDICDLKEKSAYVEKCVADDTSDAIEGCNNVTDNKNETMSDPNEVNKSCASESPSAEAVEA